MCTFLYKQTFAIGRTIFSRSTEKQWSYMFQKYPVHKHVRPTRQSFLVRKLECRRVGWSYIWVHPPSCTEF